jgi:hypothetical protein
MSARLYKQMEIRWIFVFVFVVVALNLLIISATGRAYDFWSGRRGSAKSVADLKSRSARLLWLVSERSLLPLTLAAFRGPLYERLLVCESW